MGRNGNTIALVARIADEFERRRWRDPGDAALTIAKALAEGANPRAAAQAAPSRFLAMNGVSRADVAVAVESIAAGLPTRVAGPADPRTPPIDTVGGARPSRGATNGVQARGELTGQHALAVVRVFAALAIAAVGTLAIWIVPASRGWEWLIEHDNRLALQALAEAVVVLLALGVAAWRWPILAAAAVPFFALLGLLGR